MTLIEARGIAKTFADTGTPVEVLKGVDVEVAEGEVVGIFGASGSGKSTLLHIMGGLDSPSSGKVSFRGEDIHRLKGTELAKFRNRSIGFVFQFYHLLPEFTALENVMLPPLIAGSSKDEARSKAERALDAMGLQDRMEHSPGRLSGGEQQRVAIARAAVLDPALIFADEPTGNLDHATGKTVWEYLMSIVEEKGTAMIVVSHNPELMSSLSRTCELADGRISSSRGGLN